MSILLGVEAIENIFSGRTGTHVEIHTRKARRCTSPLSAAIDGEGGNTVYIPRQTMWLLEGSSLLPLRRGSSVCLVIVASQGSLQAWTCLQGGKAAVGFGEKILQFPTAGGLSSPNCLKEPR